MKLIPATLGQADSVAQGKRKHIETNISIQGLLAQFIWSCMRVIWLCVYVI